MSSPNWPKLGPSPFSIPSTLPPLPHVPGTDPTRCVFDAFRIAIAKVVADGLGSLTVEQVYQGVDYGKKGEDFTVALPRFRLPGKVDDLAKKVLEKFEADDWVESVTHDRAFLHFKCRTSTLNRLVLQQVHALTHNTESKKPEYGSNSLGEGKRVIIEYSSPNIAKHFHVGHLRSTIIGAFLANLYRACGWDVVTMNYMGDWGSQFGLIATGFAKYGSEDALQANPIQHLFEIYVQMNKDADADPSVRESAAAWFKRMEEGDEEALKNWRVWRQLSIVKYQDEYERLNVRFDEFTGESEVSRETMAAVIQKLQDTGLAEESKGALVVNLEKYKLGTAIVRKGDGSSIYFARDLGAAIQRYDQYKFDKMIYVISSQQDNHVAQFFKTLQLMGYEWAKDLEHVNYGLVQGMSTRKGTVVFLADIIRETANRMHELMQSNADKYAQIENPEFVAQEVGISGIKIQDMSAKRVHNYDFNWDRMLSYDGDTGPYLQYAHVRLSSIERNNTELLPLPAPAELNTDLLVEAHAREIVFLLGTYPDVVKTVLKTHEPSGVTTFAFRLAHVISSAWQTLLVKNEPDREKARVRMAMFLAARDVLGAALRLLTLKLLERM